MINKIKLNDVGKYKKKKTPNSIDTNHFDFRKILHFCMKTVKYLLKKR